jgi:hypothetical protein
MRGRQVDEETRQRALYRELRQLFNRLDLRIESFGEVGAEITYVPDDLSAKSDQHPTLLANRIQCLVDITIQLGLRESTKTGERLVN